MSKVKVGDIAIINGKSLGKNIPFYKIQYLDTGSITNGIIENIQMIDCNNDTIPSRAKRMVKNNTIVYSTVRPRLRHYGILHNPQENMIVSTGFVTIDAIEERVNPLFLYYSLIKEDVTEYIASIADTAVSSYPSINPSDIADLEIDIPSILEQNKIAEILSGIDGKISNNNRINAELESMAKTIYDYWFTQFDFPDENGKPYRSSGGKMVWNDELKREIPEGWRVVSLHDIIETVDNRGKNPPYSESKTNHPIIDVATLRTDGRCIKYDECRNYVSEEIYNSWFRAGHPQKGDILFSTVGSLAETKIFYPSIFNKGTIAQNVIGLRMKQNLYSYIYQLIVSEKNKIVGYKIGSVQPSLKVGHVLSHKIVLPSQEILNKFSEIIECYNTKINLLETENQQLASLRDWLLPMLMNGQVGFEGVE